MNKLLRKTYALINLDYLADNYRALRNYLPESVNIACVVKGDGYGHGLSEVVETLWEVGARHFAVACLSEGLVVRKHLPEASILVMGDVPVDHLSYAIQSRLTLTLHGPNQGIKINAIAQSLNTPVHAHLKIDTGFNRLGFKNLDQAFAEVKTCKALDFISIDGLYSHLALKNYDADDKQFINLISFNNRLKSHGYHLSPLHIGDSIAAIDLPEYHLDMVRPGALLYGLVSHNNNDIAVKQVLTLVSHISRIAKLNIGENVSYGDSYKVDRPTVIATIPIGYGDGYPRNLSNKSFVKIKDRHFPIIGRICMDQCMVDITGAEDITIDDKVILYHPCNKSLSHLSTLSKLANTNKNELVARLSKRVPRVYIKNKQLYKITDDMLEGME